MYKVLNTAPIGSCTLICCNPSTWPGTSPAYRMEVAFNCVYGLRRSDPNKTWMGKAAVDVGPVTMAPSPGDGVIAPSPVTKNELLQPCCAGFWTPFSVAS